MTILPADRPEYSFGATADYSAWNPNTSIRMCNVPWNNDYRDIVAWGSRTQLDGYINGLPNQQVKTSMTYARINAPIRIDTPFAVANRYNYITVKNGAAAFSGDEATHFYYFVTSVEYVNPNTTQINVQLDVWTTFGLGVRFGRCFISQGHIGVAASNRFANYGRDHLMVAEGLDTGAEYRVVARRKETIIDVGNNDPDIAPQVLVLSTVNLGGPYGTKEAPDFDIAKSDIYGGVPVGMSAYIFDGIADFNKLLQALADKPWIIQGIYSVSLIPNIKRYHEGVVGAMVDIGGALVKRYWPFSEPKINKLPLWNNWRNDEFLRDIIPARYQHVADKFFTYPYMVIEATTWNGSSLIIRPELWNDANATFAERASILPPGQRVTFNPMWYNANIAGLLDAFDDDWGEHLNMQISLDSFVTIPVMNDAGALTLAQNARGMAFDTSAAEWSQTRTQAGIATSYDQASNAIATSSQQTDLANRSARQATDFGNQMRTVGTVANIGSSVAMGAVGGGLAGPAGAVAGGILAPASSLLNSHMQNHSASALQGMSAASATESNRIAGQSAGYVRDTNRDLAEFSARGDYAQSIAGQQARIQDTRMTQPSLKGNLGGDLMRALNDLTELSVRWKMIDTGPMGAIGEHWLRYGYTMNRFGVVPDNLHVMSHFTYWRLAETYIKSAPMPETYKHTIRGIFEKGVTVWRNPEDIGNIDPAINTPIGGITL